MKSENDKAFDLHAGANSSKMRSGTTWNRFSAIFIFDDSAIAIAISISVSIISYDVIVSNGKSFFKIVNKVIKVGKNVFFTYQQLRLLITVCTFLSK